MNNHEEALAREQHQVRYAELSHAREHEQARRTARLQRRAARLSARAVRAVARADRAARRARLVVARAI